MVRKIKSKDLDYVPATGKYVSVKFTDVIKVFKILDKYGQLSKLAALTKGDEHKLRFPSDTVNLIKKTVAAHPDLRQDPIGKKVIRPKAKKGAVEIASFAEGARPGRAPTAARLSGGRWCCGFDPGG